MEDLTKTQLDLQAAVWRQLDTLEKSLTTLRNALSAVGPCPAAMVAAGVVADNATELLRAAAKADGFGEAVSRM